MNIHRPVSSIHMNVSTLLEQARIRITSARTAVLEVIVFSVVPVSIQEIESGKKVADLQLDQVTIYRIIHLFMEKNLVKQVDFFEGKFRYEFAGLPHHHHIFCSFCGAVTDVQNCLKDTAIDDIEQTTGYTVSSHALEFFGKCSACKLSK